MFDGMHPGFQLFWIAPQILESPLGDDPAPVELSVHIVDRHTEDLDAVSKGIGNGMRPARQISSTLSARSLRTISRS